MRVSVAVLGIVSTLFVGISAMSEAAQQAPAASSRTAAGNASFDLATRVHDGVGQAVGEGIAWFGIAAIVIVALALLVSASAGGRR